MDRCGTLSSRSLRRLAPLGFAFALVFAACGGGAATPSPGEASQLPTPSAPESATPAPTETAARGPSPSPSSGNEAASQVEEFARLWEGRQAKVVYHYTSKEAGETDEATLTIYWKPPDWRADYESATEKISVIQLGGALYACDQANRVCLKVPSVGSVPAPFVSVLPPELPTLIEERIIEASTGYQIERSTRRIAGVEARCFVAAGGPAGSEGRFEVCWSEDGILLYVAEEGKDSQGQPFSSTMEATKFESTVSERDLEPPYPVQELPFGLPSPSA